MTTVSHICGTIDGAGMARRYADQLADFIKKRPSLRPHLHIVLVGDDPASAIYIKRKQELAERIGMKCTVKNLAKVASYEDICAHIDWANEQDDIHGIILQLPLPSHIDAHQQAILTHGINPMKDVDGMHPMQEAKRMEGKDAFTPCTPLGCLHMIQSAEKDLSGKVAVVVGCSEIVGKPMGRLLLEQNCTVIMTHRYTQGLPEYTRMADILVVAIGKPHYIGIGIDKDHIKQGSVLIDVGINRLPNGKVVGDIAPEAREVAGYISPVPGGVGPMTVSMLASNTVKAACMQSGIPFEMGNI